MTKTTHRVKAVWRNEDYVTSAEGREKSIPVQELLIFFVSSKVNIHHASPQDATQQSSKTKENTRFL
jgi:hypothetical protein